MADEGPSAESKLNIASYFIMSSPTGEVNEVLADVQKLVKDDKVLNDDAITKILKEYNHEHMAFAPDPKGGSEMVMASAFALQQNGKYLNPNNNQLLTFNHKTQKWTGAQDSKSTLPNELLKYRAACQKALEGYVAETYKQGKVCVAVYVSESGRLTVAISAKNVHLGNYWTGGWRSCYGIGVDKTGQCELKGSIKVNVHYFEDGNVQLHTSADKSATVNVSSKEEETGTTIAKAIEKIENDFHNSMEKMYIEMHSNTFKQMRRFYSIQKQPMDWRSAAHNMAHEVTASKQ